MTYILLAAGKGTRLHPITLSYPKTLFKLADNVSVIQRMVNMLRYFDANAKIIVVTGFMNKQIQDELSNVIFVYNPFYSVTNSIASLWFARNLFVNDDNVTLINGDIVMEDMLIKDILTKPADKPYVLLDSSVKKDGDYNVQVNGNRVVVMSKELDGYCGEYAGVIKFDKGSLTPFLRELDNMIEDRKHDLWFEDVLVEMIFKENFKLYFKDICDYDWTEIDCVDDLVLAREIHCNSSYGQLFG